jgi:hypothetical protein
MINTFLAGCSFTDPAWQQDIPWSVQISSQLPVYISAKAGFGIKGICTEALYFLEKLPDIKQVIVVLPNLWRMEYEVNSETYLCNCMVDLLSSDNNGYKIHTPAKRKWIIGGLHYDKKHEFAPVFDLMYKHQGQLVLLKEHMRALKNLLDYCKQNNIKCSVSAIQDPMHQIQGMDYIKSEIVEILHTVEYEKWFKFNDVFIDEFLGHTQHPTTQEHALLCNVIRDQII